MRNKRVTRMGQVAAGAVVGLGAGLGVAFSGLAGGGGAVPAGAAATAGPCSGGPAVTATGSGMAYGTPDLLTMQIGAQTTAASAASALSANNSKVQALINVLEQGGVQAKDIQTSNLSIDPNYSNGPNPVITGYQVEDDVTVNVRQLGSAGSLIDAAAARLGNDVRINGLDFSVSDPAGPLAAARANAVQVAVVEAKAMAAAAGSTLGPLCAISDAGSSEVGPQPVFAAGLAASAESPAPVPVQPGSEQFSAQVSVTYQLG